MRIKLNCVFFADSQLDMVLATWPLLLPGFRSTAHIGDFEMGREWKGQVQAVQGMNLGVWRRHRTEPEADSFSNGYREVEAKHFSWQ